MTTKTTVKCWNDGHTFVGEDHQDLVNLHAGWTVCPKCGSMVFIKTGAGRMEAERDTDGTPADD